MKIKFKRFNKSSERFFKPCPSKSRYSLSSLKNQNQSLTNLSPKKLTIGRLTQSSDLFRNVSQPSLKTPSTRPSLMRSPTPSLGQNIPNLSFANFFRESHKKFPTRSKLSKFHIKKQDSSLQQLITVPKERKFTETKSGSSWALDSGSDHYIKHIKSLKKIFNLS